ncbi:MAG: zinc-ribbon domain-containing protein [Prevotella sp.]|nr:zinc-ribbon domain-containing protein [Prevotella sp.]
MAIIKCPECGRQISDKAPTCPNCGVEIAGKVVKCPDCFNVYFKDEETCPNCHRHNDEYQPLQNENITTEQPEQRKMQLPVPPAAAVDTSSKTPARRTMRTTPPPVNGEPRKNHAPLIVSFVIALIICAICFYFYQQANNNKEREEYEFAMQSNDPLVLQTYLDSFKQAPEAHRDSITAHLNAIKQGDRDWTNAVVSGSRAAIEDYLRIHPNSTHRIEAIHKIDSLDWTVAQNQNSLEAFKEYIEQHSDGEHFAEAKQIYDRLLATVVTQEDIDMVKGLFKKYFQSINSKDESSLLTTVTSILKTFLGKENANSGDVVNFLHKIYRDDMTNMNFNLNNDFSIDKKSSDTGAFEYSVTFSAGQSVEREGKTEKNRYRIRATVSPEGKISGFNMTKIVEQPANPENAEKKSESSAPAEQKTEAKPANTQKPATSSTTTKPAETKKPATTSSNSKPAASTTSKPATTTSKPATTSSKPAETKKPATTSSSKPAETKKN